MALQIRSRAALASENARSCALPTLQVSRSGDRRERTLVLRALSLFSPTLMRCIHRSLLVVAVSFLGAASLSAQTVPAAPVPTASVPATPDTGKVATLETVTVTGESGNWFTHA